MDKNTLRKLTTGTLMAAMFAATIPSTGFAASSSTSPQVRHAQQRNTIANTLTQKAPATKNDGEVKDDKQTVDTKKDGEIKDDKTGNMMKSNTGKTTSKSSSQTSKIKKPPMMKKTHRTSSSSSAKTK